MEKEDKHVKQHYYVTITEMKIYNMTIQCLVSSPKCVVLHDIVHMYHSNSQLTAWVGVNTQVHRVACEERR